MRTIHDKNNPYVILNTTIYSRNKNSHKKLSARAIGIWSYAMSLPDSWKFNMSDLVSRFSEGRDAIRRALKQLEEAGYLHRMPKRDQKTGKMLGHEWYFFETSREKVDNLDIISQDTEEEEDTDSLENDDTDGLETRTSVNPPLSNNKYSKYPKEIHTNVCIKKDRKRSSSPPPKPRKKKEKKSKELTPEQRDALVKQHGEEMTARAIAHLAEYKESLEKPYKYTDFWAIKRWVITALREKDLREAELKQREERLRKYQAKSADNQALKCAFEPEMKSFLTKAQTQHTQAVFGGVDAARDLRFFVDYDKGVVKIGHKGARLDVYTADQIFACPNPLREHVLKEARRWGT